MWQTHGGFPPTHQAPCQPTFQLANPAWEIRRNKPRPANRHPVESAAAGPFRLSKPRSAPAPGTLLARWPPQHGIRATLSRAAAQPRHTDQRRGSGGRLRPWWARAISSRAAARPRHTDQRRGGGRSGGKLRPWGARAILSRAAARPRHADQRRGGSSSSSVFCWWRIPRPPGACQSVLACN